MSGKGARSSARSKARSNARSSTGGEAEEYPGAGPWIPAERSLTALRAAAAACRGCDLYRDATQVVMGDGPATAAMMLVGEQPGDREDRVGEPFVGPAGGLLDAVLAEAGIDPTETFRTNAVKHFRFELLHEKQRIHKSPSRWHVARCEPWLLAELDLVRPRVVVLLGATAGKALYGSSFRVGAARGRVLEWPQGYGSPTVPPAVVATTHPSAVLRSRQQDADRSALVSDLKVAARLLD